MLKHHLMSETLTSSPTVDTVYRTVQAWFCNIIPTLMTSMTVPGVSESDCLWVKGSSTGDLFDPCHTARKPVNFWETEQASDGALGLSIRQVEDETESAHIWNGLQLSRPLELFAYSSY